MTYDALPISRKSCCLCEVNPKYKKFIIYEKGKNILYVKNLKEIYGLVESALLWYKLFSTAPSDLGIK